MAASERRVAATLADPDETAAVLARMQRLRDDAACADEEQAIRTVGSAQSVEQLRETLIPVAGRSVRLGDLGEVSDEWSEARGRARFNGE